MTVYYILIHWIIPYYPAYQNCLHPKRYTFVWILTGIILSLLCRNMPEAFRYVLPLALNISLTDIREMEIPDLCQFLLFLYAVSVTEEFPLLPLMILTAGAAAAAKGKIGFGDVKLTVLISMICGRKIWNVLFTASFICLIRLLFKRKPAEEPVPFAPYLCFAFLLSLL